VYTLHRSVSENETIMVVNNLDYHTHVARQDPPSMRSQFVIFSDVSSVFFPTSCRYLVDDRETPHTDWFHQWGVHGLELVAVQL